MPSKRSKNITRWVRRHQNKHLCACGCGEYIEITREHAKPSVGIPKFRPGHNLKMSKDEIDQAIEQADTSRKNSWDSLTEEQKQARLEKLQHFKCGEDNPSWKGGRRVDEKGYITILSPGHPFAVDGYVLEHRLVVEDRTRREDPANQLLVEVNGEKYLSPKAVVHHIDEVKDNNKSENLMLLPNQKAHAFIHNSPLPMEERLRRIALGVYHSGPIE